MCTDVPMSLIVTLGEDQVMRGKGVRQ